MSEAITEKTIEQATELEAKLLVFKLMSDQGIISTFLTVSEMSKPPTYFEFFCTGEELKAVNGEEFEKLREAFRMIPLTDYDGSGWIHLIDWKNFDIETQKKVVNLLNESEIFNKADCCVGINLPRIFWFTAWAVSKTFIKRHLE